MSYINELTDDITKREIKDVFTLLNKWAKFPTYQLERRADIYFAIYLDLILNEIDPLIDYNDIIPEFPYGNPDKPSRIDYVIFRPKAVYLVELKTSSGSKGKKQFESMKNVKEEGLKTLLRDAFILIAKDRSGEKKRMFKYKLFFEDLANCLINHKIDIDDININKDVFSESCHNIIAEARRLKEYLVASLEKGESKDLRSDGEKIKIRIIYIQPNAEKDNENEPKIQYDDDDDIIIGFDYVIKTLQDMGNFHNNDLAKHFRDSLETWKKQDSAHPCSHVVESKKIKCPGKCIKMTFDNH